VIGRLSKVRKRDGRLVDFDESKIADAVYKAACAMGGDDRFLAEELAGVVTLFLEKRFGGGVPGIEQVQDMVEKVLIETGHARTAKAYILYRDKRGRVRAAIAVRSAGTGVGVRGPLVGNATKALLTPWTKSRITDALVREADLDERKATDVAAAVEGVVLAAYRRGTTRISTSTIRALVEAKLFELGYSDRVARQSLVGLPRYDVDRLLRGGSGAPGARPEGPRDVRGFVADAALTQYAMEEVYSGEVVEAHLDARLHILDPGALSEWAGAAAVAPPSPSADSWIDSTVHLVGRLSEITLRQVHLGGLAERSQEWVGAAGQLPPVEAAHRLLRHPGLRSLDRRGGRFGVSLEVPGGGAHGGPESLGAALLREQRARFRESGPEHLPQIVVHVAAAELADDVTRAALLPALAAAAETGRVSFVPAGKAGAPLHTPWFSFSSADAAEERTEPGVAAGVCGAVAVNVGALAGSLTSAREEVLLEGLESGLELAIKALRQKRAFMAAQASGPSSPLYRICSGARPLLAGSRGWDLIHLVGVRCAAELCAGSAGPEEAARMAGRLRSYAAVWAAEEGARVRLRVRMAPDPAGEASGRFWEADRERYSSVADGRDGYADRVPHSLPAAGLGGAAEALLEPASRALELRFPRDEAPPPPALYDALLACARDPHICAFRPVPWPDRRVLRPI